jgi:O-acetyl-ADP-ribose deacetylase (regulator of RNase III)
VARIELWNGDICELEVDAIVNPANLSLWMATGVGGAIKRAGGDVIEFAAVRQAPVPLGESIVTTAGNLACKAVIHAVSLDRERRTSGPVIEAAVRSAMARAREIGALSIAFPALGTGVGGFPLDEAARITVRTVRDELDRSPMIEHVAFALRGAAAYEAFGVALAESEPGEGQTGPAGQTGESGHGGPSGQSGQPGHTGAPSRSGSMGQASQAGPAGAR